MQIPRNRRKLSSFVATIAVVLLAAPAAASARDAASTITACNPDSVVVAGKVTLSGKSARTARGASLQMRFQAMPLFGFPRTGQWRTVGKKLRASGQEAFSGLGADNWIGVLSWRYKRGSRTVLSGDTRSEALKIGASKGRANCTLGTGLKPRDTTPPPTMNMSPNDSLWHRGPTTVQLFAADDFSGVQRVQYSLDGGPATSLTNGGTFEIAAEGAHTVVWSATDVAGNTATREGTVNVDDNPPTKPVVTGPAAVTADTTPTVTWQASSDSASGLRGYIVTIQRGDGSVAAQFGADASATSAKTPPLADNTDYKAVVTAVDNTSPSAQASNSDAYPFRVDSTPEATGTSPASGSVLTGSQKSGNFTIYLDRAANPSTVSATLDNVDDNTGEIAAAVGCAATPCTAITVDPSPSSLPEGRYVLTLGAVRSAEGSAFAPFTGRYSVPFIEGGSLSSSTSTVVTCSDTTATSSSFPLGPNASGETATLDFDWSATGPGSWTLQAFVGTAPAGGANDTASSTAGSGHVRLGPFNLQPGKSLSFKLTATCAGSAGEAKTTVTLSNMFGARVP